MYDEYDEAGVLVHRYGPHIFHTNDQRAYDYLARFTEWSSYQHRVLADWYGTYMPVPFNKNSMEIAFGDEKAARLIEEARRHLRRQSARSPSTSCSAQEDPELQEVADFVYQNVFLYYTQKQGPHSREVDPSVTARVPVFISRDNRYFQDAFQGMPIDGYTRLFENLLGHEKITVCPGHRGGKRLRSRLRRPRGRRPLGGHSYQGRVLRGTHRLHRPPRRAVLGTLRALALTAPSILSTRPSTRPTILPWRAP